MKLTYAGDGRFLIGIPDTDLDDDEIKAIAEARNQKDLHATLMKSGLYRPAKKQKDKTDE